MTEGLEAASPADGEAIQSELLDGVALIRIKRADKANSLPKSAKRQVAVAINEATSREDVTAIVVTGEGQRAFCAGSDINEMRHFDADQMYEMLGAERDMYVAALESPKPVVAAVNGFALGAGFILVMSCDYAVASSNARFGTPELTIGVAAPLEGFLLPSIVGLGRARAMFYTGKQIDANEATDLGLVHEVTSPESCLERAVEAARRIGDLPSDAFRIQKGLLYRLISSGSLDSVIEASRYATGLQFSRRDTANAIERFLSRSR
jgi:enoyl-CoA hydratase/carnithine racemase